MKGERMEPTRATADSRPTPRHREIIWFGKMEPTRATADSRPTPRHREILWFKKMSPRG
jgi:hypothetical protein